MIFVGWDFHLMNSETLTALKVPMHFSHHWRLALLFVVSGAGTWFALRRKRTVSFLADRFKRLFIPLVFCMFVVVPPQIFVERLDQGVRYDSYWAFQREVFEFMPYPEGSLSWHHLWFVAYLLIFTLVLAMVRGPLSRNGFLERVQVFLADHPVLIYCLGFGNVLLNWLFKPYWPEETHALLDDWATFTRYLFLFFCGYLLIGEVRIREVLARGTWYALALALPIYFGLLGIYPFIYDLPGLDQIVIFADDMFCWFMVTGLLGLGFRYLNRSNRFLPYANEAVYPFYILHQSLLLIAAYFVIQWEWGAWSKFFFLNVVTLLSCAILYEVFIRRMAFLRLLFGLKSRQSRNKQPNKKQDPLPVKHSDMMPT